MMQSLRRKSIYLGVVTAISFALSACKGDIDEEPKPLTHSDNVFASTTNWYIQKPWSEKVASEGYHSLSNQSTAVWLESVEDINPEASIEQDPQLARSFNPTLTQGDQLRLPLREHFKAATEQSNALVQLVLHNAPGQECSAVASLGQLAASLQGILIYKDYYIDQISQAISDFPHLPIAIIMEPHSLPYLVKYKDNVACMDVSNSQKWGYTNAIRYAINTLSQHANVHIYVDISSSSIFGWDDDFTLASYFVHGVMAGFSDDLIKQAASEAYIINTGDSSTGIYEDVSQVFLEPPIVEGMNTSPPGYDKIDGFITNVNDYVPLNEPYLGNPLLPEGLEPLYSALFYDWNPRIDEWIYTQDWIDRITELAQATEGASQALRTDHLGMLIDTSRNGWGQAQARLQGAETIQDPLQVDAYRIDQREHRRNWCNLPSGLGKRPQSTPDNKPWIDAYIWVNELGKSEGSSTPDFEVLPNWPRRHYQPMCDPYQLSLYAESEDSTHDFDLGTDAMEDAPRKWHWFSEGLEVLVENAWPPICDGLNDNCD